ncbi:MAG: hydantoinase/oxoprolinase family protein, partial [Rhodospirillaceae bacterium]|nr:hydantoinase/oxoprolinase family protein [Rhodospirillaceae bacterium]
DIGGTFTDIAAFNTSTGRLHFGKTLSTPDSLIDGIATGASKAGAAFSDADIFLHGSTVAINTMLERTGAKTALLITEGFRDIYEIGRVNRPDAYNLFFQKHEPLVERALRFEVHERLFAEGDVYKPLDEDHVRATCRRLREERVDAVAILLLHCYANPAHELRVREIVEEELPDAFVSTSHELSQEYREFERCSTVVANAYIGPKVKGYISGIGDRIRADGFDGSFLVVQSTGGLYDGEQAQRQCVRMLESGPAAGVIGTQALCDALGMENAIAFDMGGTTAKAGVIHHGEALTTGSALIGGYERALPIQIAMMDIFEVGTGGGSIARIADEGGLRVGPQSASAQPGPACYGQGGTEPTVTDANVLLGRLSPDRFLGGEMTLDVAAAEAAILDKVGNPLGLEAVEAAQGVLRIAVTSMSHAVKAVTTERGLDAGDFAMVAYGGAGPLHACNIAREMGIRKLIIPRSPGHFSAFGMLFSDLRYDYVRSRFARLADADFADIEAVYAELEAEGLAEIEKVSVAPERVVIARGADMRYVGQEHAVTVDLSSDLFANEDRAGIKARFDAIHDLRYGTCAPGERSEIVSLRVTVTGMLEKPLLEEIARGDATPPSAAHTGNRPVRFGEDALETATWDRMALIAGNRIEGPALIEEHASTTVLHPGDTCEVDAFGNLVISIGGPAS